MKGLELPFLECLLCAQYFAYIHVSGLGVHTDLGSKADRSHTLKGHWQEGGKESLGFVFTK